jgi:protein-tyrosine phosphatase
MTIVDSRALSLKQALAIATGQPVPFNPQSIEGDNAIQPHDKVVLVSIRDSMMPETFQDSEDVCVVEFADIEPMNINFVPPEDSEYMTEAHAKKILEFITKWHSRPERVLFLVHCRHGMCRSGAVADFVGLICGLGYWNTRRRNPQIVPNHWVQYQLFKAHFKQT